MHRKISLKRYKIKVNTRYFGVWNYGKFSFLPFAYISFLQSHAKIDYFEGSIAFSPEEFRMTFQTPKHAGESGEFFSLFGLSTVFCPLAKAL